MADPCPKCHGAGYTTAPYVMGLRAGGLLPALITCTCPAGEAFKAQIAAMATPIPEDE